MNRKQRRAAARAAEPTTRHQLMFGDRDVLESLDVHCPDCNSEVTAWTDRQGRLHRNIEHDNTCPIWRSMQ